MAMKASVVFEKPDPRYLAGEMLRGSVSIQNPDPIQLRCKCNIRIPIHYSRYALFILSPILSDIYILLSGTARVEWSEKSSDGGRRRRSRMTEYSADEEYLKDSRVVLFGEMGGNLVEFPAGMHHYNFSCLLPDLLPSTISLPSGKIEYKVKVMVDRQLVHDTLIEQPFQVTTILDLNRDSALLMAVQCEEVKSFCFCSFKPHKAIVAVTIPQGGYVPHETICVHLTLDNQSKAKFQYTVFTLQQIVSFRATAPKIKFRKQKATVVEDTVRFPEATEHKQTTMTGRLTIPMCAPTCLVSSNISTVYLMKVMVRISGYRRRVTMRIPLKIGTVAINAPSGSGTAAASAPVNHNQIATDLVVPQNRPTRAEIEESE